MNSIANLVMASVGVVASIIILFDSAVKGALCVIVGECIVVIFLWW